MEVSTDKNAQPVPKLISLQNKTYKQPDKQTPQTLPIPIITFSKKEINKNTS